MKDFYYHVNGTEFHDTEAFGDAWKKAKALAKEEHTYITRTVVYGSTIRYEFYAIGGIFLNEKFINDTKMYIF